MTHPTGMGELLRTPERETTTPSPLDPVVLLRAGLVEMHHTWNGTHTIH